MSDETRVRSHAGWLKTLRQKAEREELTMEESTLLCLHNIQNHLWEIRRDAAETRAAAEHTEGMLGAIDEMCSRIDPLYKADGEVRAALDTRRDELRQADMRKLAQNGAAPS